MRRVMLRPYHSEWLLSLRAATCHTVLVQDKLHLWQCRYHIFYLILFVLFLFTDVYFNFYAVFITERKLFSMNINDKLVVRSIVMRLCLVIRDLSRFIRAVLMLYADEMRWHICYMYVKCFDWFRFEIFYVNSKWNLFKFVN